MAKEEKNAIPLGVCSGTVTITCRNRVFVADITWESNDCVASAGAAVASAASIVCGR